MSNYMLRLIAILSMYILGLALADRMGLEGTPKRILCGVASLFYVLILALTLLIPIGVVKLNKTFLSSVSNLFLKFILSLILVVTVGSVDLPETSSFIVPNWSTVREWTTIPGFDIECWTISSNIFVLLFVYLYIICLLAWVLWWVYLSSNIPSLYWTPLFILGCILLTLALKGVFMEFDNVCKILVLFIRLITIWLPSYSWLKIITVLHDLILIVIYHERYWNFVVGEHIEIEINKMLSGEIPIQNITYDDYLTALRTSSIWDELFYYFVIVF